MKDKVIVITGSSKGLGESMARLLISKGAKVVISARGKEELNKLAKEIGATSIVADVTKEADMKKLAKETFSKFGKIDIWINNAGIWLPKTPLEEIDMEKAHDMIEVNLFGTMYGSREAVIIMKKQGFGTILNIVSTSALQGRPLQTIYSASKHAAKGLTDSLRLELEGTGIKVIGVYPGGIKTQLFNGAKPDDFDQYMEPEYVADKIITNLEKDTPDEEQILKRPGQV